MKTKQIITRTVCSIAIFMFVLFTSACKKENTPGPGNSGSFDTRIIGQWQNQEILGTGAFTQTFVDEFTFNADGTGKEETFDIGSAGQSNRQSAAFTWSGKPNNVITIKFNANAVFDVKYTITNDGNGMALTPSGGSRTIFTRMN